MERAEKRSASADVCVTRISPCRCGKGIFGASSHIFLQLYNCTALAAIVVDLVLGGDTNMKSTGSTSQEIEPVFVASLLSKAVANRFLQA